jgi:RimJ/RimL family protein N-acetyltransferase
MEIKKIEIKKITKKNIDFLFSLRNCPETYKYFKNGKPVEKEEHMSWILPILDGQRKDIFLYVVYEDEKEVGQIRFDLEDEKTAEVSISILKEYFGKNIAGKGLEKGIEKIKEKGIEKIIAEVNKNNLQSIRFFEKHGFKQFQKRENYLDFEYLIQ